MQKCSGSRIKVASRAHSCKVQELQGNSSAGMDNCLHQAVVLNFGKFRLPPPLSHRAEEEEREEVFQISN